MHELRLFALISWIALPTVMYGGFTLLGSVGDRLPAEKRDLFRAGHAHAGVLLILSLVYQLYMAATPLALGVKQGACAALAAGIILQSGGFFWRAFVGNSGKHMTRVGALLLAAAMIVLIVGLFM
jgi:hypothetical protein